MARINRSAHSSCARLYSCDPIITDRRETITRPCRRVAECNILFLPGQHWRRLIFFNHGRAASRAVYRGFLTREIHRSRSLFLLAQCAQASERARPNFALVCLHDNGTTPSNNPLAVTASYSIPDISFIGFFALRKRHVWSLSRNWN